MLENNYISNKTSEMVKNRIMNKNYSEPDFHPLDFILGDKRKIQTKIHGLFTSFGGFWEELSKELAAENNFEVLDNKHFKVPASAPNSQKPALDAIITARTDNTDEYNAESSKQAIKDFCQYYVSNPCSEWNKPAPGTGVDIYLKKNNTHYLFDTKTVKPNVSGLKSFLSQIHHWYWYSYSRYPLDDVECKIIFPYTPYQTPFQDNIVGGGNPLSHLDEWIDPDNYWRLLTDNPQAYQAIIEGFQALNSDNELNSFITDVVS